MLAAATAHAGPPDAAKVDELCRTVVDSSSNYKVRVQAALVLGKLGDARAVQPLIKALGDENRTVRGIAASALGQIGDPAALDPLRDLVRRESDSFVKGQAEKAVAALAAAGGGAGKQGAKIYVNFGGFVGGVKSAGPEAAKILHDALSRELGKLPIVTLDARRRPTSTTSASPACRASTSTATSRSSRTAIGGGGSETSCDVKVMVARWPQKSIIMWTNAGASVQSGSRPRDKENARQDCLEASARGLGEDLVEFPEGTRGLVECRDEGGSGGVHEHQRNSHAATGVQAQGQELPDRRRSSAALHGRPLSSSPWC